MDKQLITVSGVAGYVDSNGTAQLNLDNVARGLGFTDTSKGAEYVRWNTVATYLKEIGFSQEVAKDMFIPENIFYRLAFKAKNETAEKFQAKVADEILPTIRKTGGYVSNDDAFVNTYLPFADEQTKALFKSTLMTVRQQNAKIEQDKPKVLFADAVTYDIDGTEKKFKGPLIVRNDKSLSFSLKGGIGCFAFISVFGCL